MKKLIINKEQAGNRIDKIISETGEVISRATVQRLIEEEKILVNGKTTKASYKVQVGDKIEIQEDEPQEIDMKPQEIPLDVIYEDDDIIAINKPKGMVVHPANGNPDGTLVNAIMNICKDSLSGIGGEIRPGIVHRIDKDTSGLLIIAKNDKAHINLSEQIKNREVIKKYVTLVRGVIKENEATINMPIGRSAKERTKMAVTSKGKEAITHFKVLKRYTGYTLLELVIETGRTHQIRVHLAEIGYPVLRRFYLFKWKKSIWNTRAVLTRKRIRIYTSNNRQKNVLTSTYTRIYERNYWGQIYKLEMAWNKEIKIIGDVSKWGILPH